MLNALSCLGVSRMALCAKLHSIQVLHVNCIVSYPEYELRISFYLVIKEVMQ